MLGEEGNCGWGEADYGAAIRCVEGDEAAVVCVLPDHEFGAGRAPGIHGFFVGSVALGQPLKKVEDQVLYYGIAHDWRSPSSLYIDMAGAR